MQDYLYNNKGGIVFVTTLQLKHIELMQRKNSEVDPDYSFMLINLYSEMNLMTEQFHAYSDKIIQNYLREGKAKSLSNLATICKFYSLFGQGEKWKKQQFEFLNYL